MPQRRFETPLEQAGPPRSRAGAIGVSAAAIVVAAGCGLPLLGLAAMATGTCDPAAPCPAVEQINTHFGLSALAVGAGLAIVLAMFAMPHRFDTWARDVQLCGAAMALAGALWPAIWIFILGGPRP
ncbi:hypothetical protein AB0M43_14720 [Longispora sp. NPDC051575]|uniref:hypothetical protein n=1 Tax=Longispora sp. NPDC051575 TaxID=3154943 RepID=UPI003442F7BE